MQSSVVVTAPGRRRWLLSTVAALGLVVLTAALWLIPPEQTLGAVIKVIFLHGALVRVALLAFAAAGAFSLGFLWTRRVIWFGWAMAVQKGAVLLWIIYALISSISTWLSWGEWIAWDEPRVRASVHMLWFSIACLLLAVWIGHQVFAAVINLIVMGVTWTLIRGATMIRHPFDPIGASGSGTYQTLYWVMVAALLALTGVLMYWLYERELASLGKSRSATR